ncbi:two-component sensor histidine kinase [Spongiactinospora gelatinilytica]|uniref:histidine kinase n=1 Tax=Spongiactinospora gelatinilytica TaxID=2666298 RepID=A0A2W2IU80_9ACTN|nr:sensor histidine kinase [Spongiactinospora gelatinilytica]PZG53244.1 two-component sensor histidine kinase [Spongiactinospora gelatinilytica]
MNRFALVIAIGVVVFSTSMLAQGNQPDARPIDPLGWALLAGCVLGLLPRRTHPEIALAITGGAAAVHFALGYPYAFWPAPALIAVFTLIAADRRAAGWIGAGAMVAIPATAALAQPSVDHMVALLIWGLIVLVAAQLAEVSRARRAYTAEVERRAAEAERTREEAALRRAQEERLKVARELHDVTSHTISLIALHAAVAAEAVERAGGPGEARDALAVIRTASREALTEMKDILGVLRTPESPESPESSDALDARRPAPGTERLGDLITTAGVPVEMEVTGVRRPLPPAVDLTVYRVVQEALTNTIRHAAASRARVSLSFESDGLVVRIDDDGRGRGGLETGGHGLAGMAERVAAVGGRLSAGDGPDGGFQVVARLPLAPAAALPVGAS